MFFHRIAVTAMRWKTVLTLLTGLSLCLGCSSGWFYSAENPLPVGPVVYYDNPIMVPCGPPEAVWETLVDVIDDYFPIDHEDPIRCEGCVFTEGRIDTRPVIGATLLEPWRPDSASYEERLEATLQSIRRRAIVRVVPCGEGYQVEVAVFKQLEDVIRPEHADAGAATFRYDDSLERVVNPILEEPIDAGWIPQGRDFVLEQRILGHLRSRFGM